MTCDAYTILIPGSGSKPRPRFARGKVYTPRTGLEDFIAVAWKGQGYPKLAGPVGMMIAVAGRGDIDNLVKLAMDSLNGLAYEDDRQVQLLLAIKLPPRQARQMGLPDRFTAVSLLSMKDFTELGQWKQEIFNVLIALIGTTNSLARAQPLK